jgi:hypothetical protein
MKSKYSKESNSLAEAILKEKDDIKRWRMIHDLLRIQNKKARKEQDKQAKAMADVRRLKIYNTRKARKGQLRFGVSIPNITWQALVESDILVKGSSVLKDPKKDEHLTKNATNRIVQDLATAFPEYKASD